MKSLIETIADKLHDLPSPKLQEVLDFVEFLAWREHRSNLDPTEEFELLADQLADEFAAQVNSDIPQSDDAISRAGIYQEHPSL